MCKRVKKVIRDCSTKAVAENFSGHIHRGGEPRNFVLERGIEKWRDRHLFWMLEVWDTLSPEVIIEGFANSRILAAIKEALQ